MKNKIKYLFGFIRCFVTGIKIPSGGVFIEAKMFIS